MALAPFFRRVLAYQTVLRKITLPMAVASAVTLSALPLAALAQPQTTPAVSETCVVASVKFALSTSFASAPRVALGAVSIEHTSASAVSKLDQIRSVQNPGSSVALNRTQTLQPPSDCTLASNSFGAPNVAVALEDTILGAQSVRIARTPFDRDWANIHRRPRGSLIEKALAKSGARSSPDKTKQVQMINRWVNQNIVFGDDQVVYRRADYWAPASETLQRGIGDCEDLAIAKMDMLAALGVARADMRLIIARDLVRNADHAVLVVKLDGGSVMLDNVTDHLLNGQMPNDYRPIMSFSQNAKWVHGYGVQQPEVVRVALLSTVTVPASGQAPDVVTVIAEPELPVISIALLSAPVVQPTLP